MNEEVGDQYNSIHRPPIAADAFIVLCCTACSCFYPFHCTKISWLDANEHSERSTASSRRRRKTRVSSVEFKIIGDVARKYPPMYVSEVNPVDFETDRTP